MPPDQKTLRQANLVEYTAWNHMRRRCFNPKDSSYRNYGGRNIQVCNRWKTFANFLEDMGKRPSCEYSLDRIDNNGNYEPRNCRWATQSQQKFNTRTRTTNKSGYRGVSWYSRYGKWRVRIRQQLLGYFDTKEEAAQVYEQARGATNANA